MAGIIDIDRGWAAIQKELHLMQGSHSKVGVQMDDGEKSKEKWEGASKVDDPEVDLYEVAVTNEYGSPVRKIPERSFLRSTTDEERQKTNDMLETGVAGIYAGRTNVKRVLFSVGAYLAAQVQRKIVDMKTPRNALRTRLAKGARIGPGIEVDNPLIDTGQLRQSIRHVEVLNE